MNQCLTLVTCLALSITTVVDGSLAILVQYLYIDILINYCLKLKCLYYAFLPTYLHIYWLFSG